MKLFPLDVSVFSPNLFPFPLGTSEVSEVKKKINNYKWLKHFLHIYL